MNIMMLLEMAADACGDRTAFFDASNGASISYRGLFKAAEAKAQLLRESDAARCVVLDVSNLTVPVALFSASWAGIPYVPLNYRLTEPEINALLERVKPAFFVTDSDRAKSYSGRNDLVVHDRRSFQETKPEQSNDTPWALEPDDIAALLFTSGTTGTPKAAIMRQKHLVSYILQTIEFMSAEEDEATLVSVPPYHIAGIASVISSVYSCRKVVQLASFTPEAWLQAAREQKITTAFVVPTMLSRIVDHLEYEKTADLPSLQSLSYGGGKMAHTIIERAMELFPGTEFTNAYGLTETSSTVTLLGPDEHRAAASSDDPAVVKRLASAGLPLPGIEISIRDTGGNEVGADVHGEIFVRGDQISGEYEGRDSVVDGDGWFPTKDAGYVDSSGYLFLDGRADDIIVRGGENLSPGEIEDVLIEHEAVHDAAAIGIPSEEWGEAVVAVVQLQHDQTTSVEELQDFVKNHLRSSRVPEQIEFWDELPYNDTGKLLRRIIRDEFGTRSQAN